MRMRDKIKENVPGYSHILHKRAGVICMRSTKKSELGKQAQLMSLRSGFHIGTQFVGLFEAVVV